LSKYAFLDLSPDCASTRPQTAASGKRLPRGGGKEPGKHRTRAAAFETNNRPVFHLAARQPEGCHHKWGQVAMSAGGGLQVNSWSVGCTNSEYSLSPGTSPQRNPLPLRYITSFRRSSLLAKTWLAQCGIDYTARILMKVASHGLIHVGSEQLELGWALCFHFFLSVPVWPLRYVCSIPKKVTCNLLPMPGPLLNSKAGWPPPFEKRRMYRIHRRSPVVDRRNSTW
jgi:hypothetical protein